MLEDLITFSVTSTELIKTIGNKKTAANIISKEIKPPKKPNPHAKPEILPIFF